MAAHLVVIMNRTGIIWVAEEKKEAVKKMLNDLPYIDKAWLSYQKTAVDILISPLVEQEELVEMKAKIAEIANTE